MTHERMFKCHAALVDPIIGLSRVVRQRVRCPHNRRYGHLVCRKHLAAIRLGTPVFSVWNTRPLLWTRWR